MEDAIELLILDVDGVLTDGTMLVGDDGRVQKRFSFLDGAGIHLALRQGLRIAICSGHDWPGSRWRFERLGVPADDVLLGVSEKGPAVDALLERHALAREQVAAMGDDVFDLPMFARAGFRATTPDAHPEVASRADYVTQRRGGQGAVREVIDLLLGASGRYEDLVRSFDR